MNYTIHITEVQNGLLQQAYHFDLCTHPPKTSITLSPTTSHFFHNSSL